MFTLILYPPLRGAQARLLLWGFWVNDCSVTALQILCDRHRVGLALLHFTLQEVLIKIGDALKYFD